MMWIDSIIDVLSAVILLCGVIVVIDMIWVHWMNRRKR